MSNIIIFGPPGSGKGTQAKMLANLLNSKHLSVGNILREAIKKNHPLSKNLQKTMFKGDLVDDEIVNKIISDQIKEKTKNKFIFDGYPRNLKQAKFLDKIIDPKKIKVFYLDVSEKETLTRLSLRGRDDDSQENVKRRWKIYKKSTEPLFKYYKKDNRLKRINGKGEIKDIFNNLKKSVNL